MPAYGIAAVGVFQITTYCVLGEIVENSVMKPIKLGQQITQNVLLFLYFFYLSLFDFFCRAIKFMKTLKHSNGIYYHKKRRRTI